MNCSNELLFINRKKNIMLSFQEVINCVSQITIISLSSIAVRQADFSEQQYSSDSRSIYCRKKPNVQMTWWGWEGNCFYCHGLRSSPAILFIFVKETSSFPSLYCKKAQRSLISPPPLNLGLPKLVCSTGFSHCCGWHFHKEVVEL